MVLCMYVQPKKCGMMVFCFNISFDRQFSAVAREKIKMMVFLSFKTNVEAKKPKKSIISHFSATHTYITPSMMDYCLFVYYLSLLAGSATGCISDANYSQYHIARSIVDMWSALLFVSRHKAFSNWSSVTSSISEATDLLLT